ncbi:bifunctional peptidase and arginyl-hydroxylase JMJD5-like isoform X3 [Cloeon dipterum]|uniref:bifunctional peptidase and arginyl-hydroxylase JMJD5-like isoform X3 n=1 Tax=Cloeon dipterum TaxID=197152 RepID=UPI00321FC51A
MNSELEAGSALAALFDAWTAAEATPVGADLAQQFFLYSQARVNFLNKNLDLAAEYCQHAKEAATEAVNTGKFSEAGEARSLYAQVGLLEALICVERGNLGGALTAVDMVLLMGAPDEVTARAADLLAERLSSDDAEELQEPWQDGLSYMRGWEQCKAVPEAECPSVHAFWRDHMCKETPIKLTNTIEHFPARKKWTLRYLLKVAGRRTVPVELGRDYTHAHWTQQLMPLGEFVRGHLLHESPITGYLAQHSLFLQIPRLMDDLLVPDYCSEAPDMNVWLGPAGTVSPLHHDPKHNLLAQIRGYKRVLLFPAGIDGLYPYPGECLMANTSQVDPESPDPDRFPLFPATQGLSCLLAPGDVLYIPPKWWHHVRSLTPSLSVSYWWKPDD